MSKTLKPWCLASVILVFCVVVLGAYTRLKDAGLGCPDWPGCYGSMIAPTNNLNNNLVEVGKAWTEMIHRYVAGSLGLLIIYITARTISLRKVNNLWILACITLSLVVFQALLGMWTVTLKLYPIVVMGHLLGGMAILSLCWLLFLNTNASIERYALDKQFKIIAYLSLIMLCIQIALGGWTSANYAGLVCADFPSCQGKLWPPMDWKTAFNLTAVGIFDSPGTPLENTARVTIQMAHRAGALVATVMLSLVIYKLFTSRKADLRNLGLTIAFLLCCQIMLGIGNVYMHLPLSISLLHNAVAALLLISLLTVIFKIHAKPYHI